MMNADWSDGSSDEVEYENANRKSFTGFKPPPVHAPQSQRNTADGGLLKEIEVAVSELDEMPGLPSDETDVKIDDNSHWVPLKMIIMQKSCLLTLTAIYILCFWTLGFVVLCTDSKITSVCLLWLLQFTFLIPLFIYVNDSVKELTKPK